jgi:putative membrane protein
MPGSVKGDPWKGAVAGMLGGILASFAMNRVHALWTAIEEDGSAARRKKEQGGQLEKGRQQRKEKSSDEPSATEKAAQRAARLIDVRLDRSERKKAGVFFHYAFGATLGALYGAAAEAAPRVAAGGGLPFGTAVWIAADEIGTPAAGLAPPPSELPLSVHLQSLAAHFAFGATTELVRRALRGS